NGASGRAASAGNAEAIRRQMTPPHGPGPDRAVRFAATPGTARHQPSLASPAERGKGRPRSRSSGQRTFHAATASRPSVFWPSASSPVPHPPAPPLRRRAAPQPAGPRPSQQGRAQQQASTQPTGPTLADRAEAPATESRGPQASGGSGRTPPGLAGPNGANGARRAPRLASPPG